MNIKSIFAGSVAALTIFSFAGGNLVAPVAKAATEAETQAQIAALLAQIAALQGSTGSTSCYTFSTDLTLGSDSEGVRALQVYLNNKGYMVATSGAGSKGNETTYFGGLTRTALAKYQAAMGISPAAGYFGPITRAKVNADCTSTNPGTNPGGNNNTSTPGGTTLTGGEANLSDFNLRSEESDGNEGESEVEVFTAEFDVEDGDIRIERMEIMASATDLGQSTNPWDYFDAVTIMVAGDEVASMDVDSRDDWDEEDDDVYRLTITDIDEIVREDDQAEITVAFDIASNIDTDDQAQEFTFYIEDEGIRSVDAEGIDQYIGDEDETVDFGFGAEENGDLSVQSSNADPDSAILVADEDDESDEYTVFAFDIENDDDVDSLITDLDINVTSSLGNNLGETVIRRATLEVDGDEFDAEIDDDTLSFEDIDVEIAGDDEQTFRLMVTLTRNASGTVQFSVASSTVDAEGADSGDDAEVDGSASSAVHTIALNGITVVAEETDAITRGQNDTVGEFTIVFSVSAMDDDAYISTTSDALEASDEGVTYTIFAGNSTTTFTSQTSVLTSNADTEAGFYVVEAGDTEEFTLTVTLDPAAAGTYSVGLNTITFNEVASYVTPTVFTVDSGDSDFRTNSISILQ